MSRTARWGALVRDRQGWRLLVLDGRMQMGNAAGCDPMLIDAPPGTWLRLRDSDGAVLACGQGVQRAGAAQGLGATLERVLPLQPLRLGAVAVIVVELESEVGGGATPTPMVRIAGAWSGSGTALEAFGELILLASTDWPLMLYGESGTGKELAAAAAHAASPRRNRPLVAISAAALPPGTLHAELFGARKGAYTGSVAEREGAFGRADGGTLLIDEVGELDAAAQAALLRVLECGEITPLGGETRVVDVRVLAATHCDLGAAVAAGRFRLDLFHRLTVGSVLLPPLRQRGDDAVRILAQFLGRPVDAAAAAEVRAHDWPGNLRELRNVARRVGLSIADGDVTAADLRAAIAVGRAMPARAAVAPALDPAARMQRVEQALAATASTAAACRAAGLPRASFYRLLRELREQAAA